MRNFLGHDGFIWWIGVVEDIDDPLTLGRCKVRCFGYHPAIKENAVPTEDLPWALAIHPLNTPNLYGTPRLGEWVFGFFLDSLAAQEPAILGYIPGIPQVATEYFGVTPNLTRNFETVTEKESVVLNVNGTMIEVLKDGNLNIKSNTHLTISSNNITISGNAIAIFANNTLNISNTINITKEPTGNIVFLHEDQISVFSNSSFDGNYINIGNNTINITKESTGNTILIKEDQISVFADPLFDGNYINIGNNTINITKESTGNTILIEEDLVRIKNTKNENNTINIDENTIIIDKQTVTMTGEIITMTGNNTLSITDFSKSFTPTSIDAGIELAKTLPVPSLP
jgi:hypothetical protein